MAHTPFTSRSGLLRGVAIVASGLATLGVAPAEPGDGAKPGAPAHAAPGMAVVELFTSEGCSSCPAADRALAELHARTMSQGTPVYTLAFHVDYWNNLGWPDRFSKPEYTQRQYDHARALALGNVYTPQAIVNGAVEFVGNDRTRLDAEVAKALKATPAATVSFTQTPWSKGTPLNLAASVSNAPAGSELCAALCEDGLESVVKRGENSGRTLSHDGVVRAFVAAPIGKAGKVSLTLAPPGDMNAARACVVLFVQDAGTMKILGAHAAPVQVATPHDQAPAAPAK